MAPRTVWDGAKEESRPSQRTCILILGMHRSGTSAITRVVNLLGAALPKNVMGGGPGNEAGHWEADRIVDLNGRLLAELGLKWDSLQHVELGELSDDIREFYVREIVRLIRAEYGNEQLFVLKDPRISVLLPLYQEAFSRLDLAVSTLVMVRHPDDVASSLQRRDGMQATQAYLLWLIYNLAIFLETEHQHCAVMLFDELGTWRVAINRLDAILGTNLSPASPLASAEIENYISIGGSPREDAHDPRDAERSLAVRLWKIAAETTDTASVDRPELKDITMGLKALLRSLSSSKTEAPVATTPSRGETNRWTQHPLDEIGQHYGTDKSSRIHDYLNFYESRFAGFREQEFTLIEIGVFRGASVRMWADYFPNARIVGVDYEPSARTYADSRISIVIGNAGDPGFLESLTETFGRPRLVIDDASHRWDHQITGLQTLFPLVQPGGHYVVEDIDTSFEGHLRQAPFQGESLISAFDYTYKLTRYMVGDAAMGSEGPYDSFVAENYKHVNSVEYYRRVALINKRMGPRP